jgi:hypothetical protein
MALERITNLRPLKRYQSERHVLVSLTTSAVTIVGLQPVFRLASCRPKAGDTVHFTPQAQGATL